MKICTALGLLAVTAVLATPAAAGYQTASTDDDGLFSSPLVTQAFVFQGRIGNNNATNGDYELSVGESTSVASQLTSAQFSWVKGGLVDVTARFDGDRQLTLELARSGLSRSIRYTLPTIPAFNALALRGFASFRQGDPSSSVALSQLKLTENAITEDLTAGVHAVASAHSVRDILLIEGLSGGAFTLTGKAAFGWPTGVTPHGSNLAFQVMGLTVVPEPAAWLSMGVGLAAVGLFARARRDRRAAA